MSNNLDPDQARRNVGPDLGPNCLQRISLKLPLAEKSFEIAYLVKSGHSL